VTDHPASLLSDQGHSPSAIASRLALPPGKVYAVLRRERPNRTRAARRCSSEVPAKVAALAAAGLSAKRIAELCGCSKAYIYRLLQEAR
jgi:transposase